jgi:putative ABC transport system substrate-binding protein
LNRRDLFVLLGGAAAFPSLAAAAEKPFRVGIASLVNPRSASQFVGFEQRVRELAAAAGQDVEIDFTLLDRHAERYPAAMQELVRRGAEVLLAPGQEIALKAARAATQTIPIVMVAVGSGTGKLSRTTAQDRFGPTGEAGPMTAVSAIGAV